MGIFSRIGDIIKSNISDLKNDEKNADEIIYEMRLKLSEINSQAHELIELEKKAEAALEENRAERKKFSIYRSKAEAVGNTDDAEVFSEKLEKLEYSKAILETNYQTAHENAEKIKTVHDRFAGEIAKAEGKLKNIGAVNSVAEANQMLSQFTLEYGDAGRLSYMLEQMETEAELKQETAEFLSGETKEDKDD